MIPARYGQAVRKAEAETRKAEIGRSNLARVRERANLDMTNIPYDAVIHCSGDYAADERLALARHYAKHSPGRLKARRVLVPVPSLATEGLLRAGAVAVAATSARAVVAIVGRRSPARRANGCRGRSATRPLRPPPSSPAARAC